MQITEILLENSPFIVELVNDSISDLIVDFDYASGNYKELVNQAVEKNFARFDLVLLDICKSNPQVLAEEITDDEKQKIKDIKGKMVLNLKAYLVKKIGQMLEDVEIEAQANNSLSFEDAVEERLADSNFILTKNELCKMLV